MNKNAQTALKIAQAVWNAIRPLCVWLVSLSIVAGMVFTGYGYLKERYIQPVLPEPIVENDPSFREISIKSGSTVKAIARQLEDEGIIRNRAIFQYAAEFLSKGPKLQAGSFLLSPKMTVIELIDTLSSMQEAQTVMRFTVIEGSTVESMAESLVKQGVFSSADRFLELCKTGKEFADDYDFVSGAIKAGGTTRKYALEGYLFPDTYEIYVGSSEETVIRKMLTRMDEMLSLAKTHSGQDDQTTVDDIVILASIIEKESKRSDFYKVSAVFHNRLDMDMKLQSDATITYVTGRNNLVLSADELTIDSIYNTYVVDGLPAGPICSPSKFALEAALYPDPDFVDDGMLYFCNGDPETGELVFSKTYEKHQENVNKYRELWLEYDRNNAEANAGR
ncbi:MAG: endolytic transglycosylase MltG [Christensenellales bacterium]|jgi:UPF0755 protein